MVEDQFQQELQEGWIENFVEYSEVLFESSAIGAAVCPWEKNIPILNEEESGKEIVEEPQEHNLHLPSTDLVYTVCILPAARPTPEAPTRKATPFALPVLQKFKKLVATVQAFTTTSKTLAAAHTA